MLGILITLSKIKQHQIVQDIKLLFRPALKSETNYSILFYKQFITKNQLCFDIGANVGAKTNIFYKLGAITVAVEPDKNAFQFLQNRFRFYNRITLLNIGLGENLGAKKLFESNNHALSTFDGEDAEFTLKDGRFKDSQFTNKLIVEISTLDNLIKLYGTPTYCKISTVGYELAILNGLSTPISNISITCNIPYHIEKTLDSITKLETLGNYSYNYILSNIRNGFASEKWMDESEIKTIIKALPDSTQSRYIEVFAMLKK